MMEEKRKAYPLYLFIVGYQCTVRFSTDLEVYGVLRDILHSSEEMQEKLPHSWAGLIFGQTESELNFMGLPEEFQKKKSFE